MNLQLHEMIKRLVCGTSDKFVPQPSKDDILGDLLLGIRRFANDIRWKEFWMLKKAEDAKSVLSAPSPSNNNNNNNNRMFEDTENQCPTLITDTTDTTPCKTFLFPNAIPDHHKGFGTMLKPTEKKSRAPKGSDQLESFIPDMEEHLIELALDPNNKYKPNERAKEIRDIAKQVSNQDHIIVPTDKTNSFSVMPTEEYKQKFLRHLLKDGQEISGERLILAQEQAEELLEDIDRLCSKGERDFIQESLKSKAIPSPKLLIKDHKKKDKWGNFPTRLVIPATNFTSAFIRW
jgi:hypothetical protein